MASAASDILHATTVAMNGKAALISGVSGSGKSSLALQLLALGASLVADDRTKIWRAGTCVFATAPETISGQIEARGVGILHLEPLESAEVKVVIDMDTLETERFPMDRFCDLLGVQTPVIRKSNSAHFPAALVLYLTANRSV